MSTNSKYEISNDSEGLTKMQGGRQDWYTGKNRRELLFNWGLAGREGGTGDWVAPAAPETIALDCN